MEQAGLHIAYGTHFKFGGGEAFDQVVLEFVEGSEAFAVLVEDMEEFFGIGIGMEKFAGGQVPAIAGLPREA
jgi:hypothetical protein